jgi:hypothetical protein
VERLVLSVPLVEGLVLSAAHLVEGLVLLAPCLLGLVLSAPIGGGTSLVSPLVCWD